MAPIKVIISGGGTGGHIFPAIAIADAIKAEQPLADILFVGAIGRMEMERVPKAGYPIEGLWISGFQRSWSLKNLIFPFKVLWSLFQAWRLVGRFTPDVVVGVGGFASGPLLRAAIWRGVPALIQEQNGYAGLTNKILAAKVQRICVAYKGMEQFFPAEKLLFTGNPVRKDMGVSSRAAACLHLKLDPERPIIAVLGGSLGARTLNEAVASQVELLRQKQVQVIWQCGKSHFEKYEKSEAARLQNVHLQPFIDRMELVYAAADVVVARAGALTISELCMAGKAAILVPSPHVAEDHQTKNAQALVALNAAILVPDAQGASTALPKAVALLEQHQEREQLAQNAKALARPNAARDIALAVIGLAPSFG